MANAHPDFSVIEAVPRTQSLLAMLPRLDRSGMKSLNLVLPADIAHRLRQEVLGSSTQAVAIITRWVLQDLEENAVSLVWTGEDEQPYRLERGVAGLLIDASGRKSGNEVKEGCQSMLASMPPLTHQVLRTSCKGSLRAIVMTALEYGIRELDRREQTLTLLQEDGVSAIGGQVVINLEQAKTETYAAEKAEAEKKKQRLAGICQTLSWLGYDAIPFDPEMSYSGKDILVTIGSTNVGGLMSFPGRVLEAPRNWYFSEDPPCWFTGSVGCDSGGYSMWRNAQGEDLMEALSGHRSTYCKNCGSGVKGTHFTRVFVPSRGTDINLCGHCIGMYRV